MVHGHAHLSFRSVEPAANLQLLADPASVRCLFEPLQIFVGYAHSEAALQIDPDGAAATVDS
jgi:hypothetical protein